MIRLPEHIAIVLTEMALRGDGAKVSIFAEEILERLSSQFDIECPHGLVEEALEILKETGGCRALPSPLTGPYYQLDAHKAGFYFGHYPVFSDNRGEEDYDAAEAYELTRRSLHDKYPVIVTYFEADSKWFEQVVTKLVDMDLAREFYVDKQTDPQTSVDESIVLADEPRLEEIRSGLDELAAEILQSNEAGEIFGDDRIAIAAEVSALRTVFEASRVRVAAVISQSRNTLGWIIEKGAGAVVGELAKKLLHLILGLIG